MIYLGANSYSFTNDNGEKVAGTIVWLIDDDDEFKSKGHKGLIPFKVSMQPAEFAKVFADFDAETNALQKCEVTFGRKNKILRIALVNASKNSDESDDTFTL